MKRTFKDIGDEKILRFAKRLIGTVKEIHIHKRSKRVFVFYYTPVRKTTSYAVFKNTKELSRSEKEYLIKQLTRLNKQL